MRKEYSDRRRILAEKDIINDPFELFHHWFEVAKQKAPDDKWTETNAVCLSTATKDGRPSSRMVLLKGYDPINGFTIFTNYESRKGMEIRQNSHVALLFYWNYLSRQIRIEGCARKSSPEESDKYFHSRPRISQISARVSEQSRPIDSRETLIQRQQEEVKKFGDNIVIPRPDFWGGFHIQPERFEFWQGQSDRTHDRFIFELDPIERKWQQYYRIQP
nr:pyridoxine/pyridoxamine 5'-phosphate oxidase-like isoform X2 [Dermatophagoides farinae]